MPSLFVDTSGWGNLIAASEPHHSAAAEGYGGEEKDNPYNR